VVNALFDPPALWRARCSGEVSAQLLPCGHYLPEEQPDATATALLDFFRRPG
jgi:haloacetate dehalogenase